MQNKLFALVLGVLIGCSGFAGAYPIDLIDLGQPGPVETFEGLVGIEVPAIPGMGAGLPSAGLMLPSGIVFVSPDPNPPVSTPGLILGEFNEGPFVYDLVANGIIQSPAELRSGTGFAGVWEDGGNAVLRFSFPIPVTNLGFFASSLLDGVEPLSVTLTAYREDGIEIDEYTFTETLPAPLGDENFIGLGGGEPISYFDITVEAPLSGGMPLMAFDDIMWGPDCNGNALPDHWDILHGEPDADSNGIPDICESAGADDCANATAVAEGSYPFDNSGAMTDGMPEDCGLAGPLNDIWFSYTASYDGPVTASVCGSDFDTVVAVYPNSPCPPPPPALVCDDDYCGLQSSVSFHAVMGESFLVRVGSFGETTGQGTLVIDIDREFATCGSGGDCFSPHVEAGCDDAYCCATVCEGLPECCTTMWTISCATAAMGECGGGEEVAIYADPRESTVFDLPSTGAGRGRSPQVDYLGRVTDNPISEITSVPQGDRSEPQQSTESTRPGEVVGRPNPHPTPRPRPRPPKRRECVPETPPSLKRAASSPAFRALMKLAGAKSLRAGHVNEYDLGLGVGWNYSTAAVMYDSLANRYVMIGRDSEVTVFTDDGYGGWMPSAGGYYDLSVAGSIVTATHKSGMVYEFQQMTPAISLPGTAFLLKTITDPNGQVIAYEYSSGKVTKITDPEGRETTFTHYPDGHIQTITDHSGREVKYEYTDSDLTAIEMPDGSRIEYTYDSDHQMLTKTVPSGETYTLDYTATSVELKDGNNETVVHVQNIAAVDLVQSSSTGELSFVPGITPFLDGDGYLWQYEYNNCGQVVRIIDPDLNETLLGYDSLTREVSYLEDANHHITTYEYDDRGNLVRSVDAMGNITIMKYDPVFSNLTLLIEPDGDQWQYDYDANGNMTAIIDPVIEFPVDKVIAYDYGSNGMMIRMEDRNGFVTTYANSNGLVKSTTIDPGGLDITTTYEYDTMGRVTATINDRGVRSEFVHDDFNQVTKVTIDAGGLDLVTDRVFNSNGSLIEETDPKGIITSYDYDERDRLVEVIRDVGGLEITDIYGYDGRDNRTTEIDDAGNPTAYEFDSVGNLDLVTDAESKTIDYSYDPVGNRISETDHEGRSISYSYDPLNRLITSVEDPGGLDLTTQIDYSSLGCGCGTPGGALVHKLTDPDGRVTYQYYDSLDRLVTRVKKHNDVADNGGDSDDAINSFDYDYNGNVVRITVANFPYPDQVTSNGFDAANRQVSQTLDPDGAALTTSWVYDGVSNVIQQTEVNGNVLTMVYDNADRLETISDPIGLVVAHTYDSNGNLETKTDSNSNGFTYQYDSLNRLTHEYDGNGYLTEYQYDRLSRPRYVIDRESNQTEYKYDNVGNLTQIISPLTAPNPSVVYTQDSRGRRLTQTDGSGNVTSYDYDDAGRLETETFPDLSTRTYEHDGIGNTTKRTDQNGDVTDYVYNDLNLLTERSYTLSPTSPAVATPTDTYIYDRTGNLRSADNSASDLDFDYDAAGRITTSTQDSLSVEFTYTTLAPGISRQISYPGGRTITETRDRRNRLTQIAEGTPVIASFGYDGAGRMNSRSYPGNLTSTSYTLDSDARVMGITHSNSNGVFANTEYGRDREGSPTFIKKHHDPANSELYSYDSANRLISFHRGTLNAAGDAIVTPGTIAGALQQQVWNNLDPLGNWKEQNITVDGVSATQTRGVNSLNQYTHIAGKAWLYDNNGNLVKSTVVGDSDADGDIDLTDYAFFANCLDGPRPTDPPYVDPGCARVDFTGDGDVDLEDFMEFAEAFSGDGNSVSTVTTYEYDCENRLVRVVETDDGTDTEVVHYEYDANNRMIRRVEAETTTTYFVYDDARRVVEERDGSKGIVATYVNGDWIDEVLTMDRGGQQYYLHRDALGSVVAATDGSGTVVESYAYDPYGKPFIFDGSGTTIAASGIGNPYMYTSRRYNSSTGLYDYRARHYDPVAGRFLQRDPLGYTDGQNLYQYATSQATLLNDPLGLIAPGKTICVSKGIKPFKKKISGNVGPVSWSAGIKVKLTASLCLKCCPPGTPRAYSWVIDNILKVSLTGSASASGSSYGGKIGPIGFWAGVKVSASLSATASARFASDRCNNREFTGRLCISAKGSISVSGGAQAYLKTWLGTAKLGADITGTGTATLTKCLFCSSGGCSWQPGKFCLSASVKITVNALVISGTWTLWSGKKCWTV